MLKRKKRMQFEINDGHAQLSCNMQLAHSDGRNIFFIAWYILAIAWLHGDVSNFLLLLFLVSVQIVRLKSKSHNTSVCLTTENVSSIRRRTSFKNSNYRCHCCQGGVLYVRSLVLFSLLQEKERSEIRIKKLSVHLINF